jgi:putative transposase
MRKIELVTEEYYHIFNRGVDKRSIFLDKYDYDRFLLSMYFLNSKEDGLMDKWRNLKKSNPKAKPSEFRQIQPEDRLVDISCFCQNDNHYHQIMKQLQDRGIQIFMHRLGTSYTMYFNKKYKRTGSLFQGVFKSVHISTNEQLLYLSAYVNKNHFIHGYKEGNNWKYCSLPDYLDKNKSELKICNTSVILDQFSSIKEYEKFMHDNALYMKEEKSNHSEGFAFGSV